jgi:hypothetical protein
VMKANDLSRYIDDPSLMGPGDVRELSQLVNEFPYFQTAHILLTLAAKRFDAGTYQQSLKKTAIVATNRGRLFELISHFEETPAFPGNDAPGTVSAHVGTRSKDDGLVLLKVVEHESEKAEAASINVAEKTRIPEEPTLEKLEPEISRQVVTSFVEKEVLRTPELHKPVSPPDAVQPVSFGDWLSYLKKNNGQSYEQIEAAVRTEKDKSSSGPGRQAVQSTEKPAGDTDRKQRNKALIDQIIEKNPGHIRSKEDTKFYTPEIKAKESLLDNEHLVTETLARIYALQGNTGKAIRAYQILSLKNPQKSAYFAGLIQKLRNNDKTE